MINLLPPEYKRTTTLEEKIISVVIISCILSALIIMGSFYYRLVLESRLIEQQLIIAEERLSMVNDQMRELSQLEKEIEEGKKELGEREDFLGRDLDWILILEEFRVLVPSDTWVESFEVSNESFNLKGYTFNHQGLNNMLKNLRTSKSFEGIRLVSSNKRTLSYQGYIEEDTYYFEIIGMLADSGGDYYNVR
ncbi:PilN domain-containing protein [Halonatronum saccharophilum]|uniref:PilN domain-containing protein n=1 Tax=Halonatronum saccharophilum TaxID=150060 RepID=UPI00048528CA|nr:PilN domain-containing protein [Halonatronum saccharophilum]